MGNGQSLQGAELQYPLWDLQDSRWKLVCEWLSRLVLDRSLLQDTAHSSLLLAPFLIDTPGTCPADGVLSFLLLGCICPASAKTGWWLWARLCPALGNFLLGPQQQLHVILGTRIAETKSVVPRGPLGEDALGMELRPRQGTGAL